MSKKLSDGSFKDPKAETEVKFENNFKRCKPIAVLRQDVLCRGPSRCPGPQAWEPTFVQL